MSTSTTEQKEMSTKKDAIDLLIDDHRAIESTFTEMKNSHNMDPNRKQELAGQLIRMLVIHSMTEETELYPKLQNLIADGKNIEKHNIDEHKSLDLTLLQIEKTDPKDPVFDTLIKEAYSKFKDHITEEEAILFPAVRQHMDKIQLQTMSDRMNTVRQMVPTHPHPEAPLWVRESKTVGGLVGIIDRVKDFFTNAANNQRQV